MSRQEATFGGATPEAGYSHDKVGLLKKSLSGTPDAPANWEAAIREVMLKAKPKFLLILP